MRKYEKPHARNLGDLLPVFGQCYYGKSAGPGPYNLCQNGVGSERRFMVGVSEGH